MSLLENLSRGKYRIIQVTGPTGCGRTPFVLSLLKHIKEQRPDSIKELDNLFRVTHNYLYLAPRVLTEQYYDKYNENQSGVFMPCGLFNNDFAVELRALIMENNISTLVVDEIRFPEKGIASQAMGMQSLVQYFWSLREKSCLKTMYVIKEQVQNLSTFPSSRLPSAGSTMLNHASDLTIKIGEKGLSLEKDVCNSILDFDFKKDKIILKNS